MKTLKAVTILLLALPIGLTAQTQKKVLVVYFSHSGNTMVIADYIKELSGDDIFRIEPVDDYPKEYHAVVDQAPKEIIYE